MIIRGVSPPLATPTTKPLRPRGKTNVISPLREWKMPSVCRYSLMDWVFPEFETPETKMTLFSTLNSLELM
jgi:hypothetical protein